MRRYRVEAYWSILESASREIHAANADEALQELINIAASDPSFYELTEAWGDTAGSNSFEVWSSDRKRLLRSCPSSEEQREALYLDMIAALREALPFIPSGSRRKFGRLLRRAEAARN